MFYRFDVLKTSVELNMASLLHGPNRGQNGDLCRIPWVKYSLERSWNVIL